MATRVMLFLPAISAFGVPRESAFSAQELGAEYAAGGICLSDVLAKSGAILAGSFPSIVILGLLVYYRVPFQEAARKARESRKETTRLV